MPEGLAQYVVSWPVVRQAHHERKYEITFVLSDSGIGISSDSAAAESLPKDISCKTGPL